MSTPEGKVKACVKKILNAHHAYHHWPVQTGYGSACLDCHGCHYGDYFAIETKAPGKHPTARQEITMEDINASKGSVFIIGESFDGTHYSGELELEAWLTSHEQR